VDSNKNKPGNRMVVFDLTSNLCVWSKAGVSKPRVCHNVFDCTTCAFDKKVQREFQEMKKEGAGRLLDKKRYGDVPFEERKCRYMLTGQVPMKYCVRGFNCASCEYDQMMEETGTIMGGREPAYKIVAGFMFPEDYYFHQGHTWARIEYGGFVRIGMDDFSLRLLGPLDHFDLPKLGMAVKQNEPGFSLDRRGNQARVQCPVDGVVVALNPEINTAAAAANTSPYGNGWLFMVKPSNLRPNLHHLLFPQEAENWLENEVGRLTALLGGTDGQSGQRMAATGGRALEDIFGSVPGLNWEKLVREFLHT
jgi:glycine cleavage system H lipoate-binding protein